MRVIIVGCGRIGSHLAYALFKTGHEVAVVDADAEAFSALPSDFNGRMIEGDALNQDVLHRAGIEKAEALCAVSKYDALNLAVSHIADEIYHIKRVISRNYDPNCLPMFDAFGVQTVSSSMWGSQRMEEMISDSDVRTIFSAGNGEVDIYEISIPAHCEGKTVQEVFGSEEIRVVSVARAGTASIPEADFVLKEDDYVLASATFKGIHAVRQCLQSGKEGN